MKCLMFRNGTGAKVAVGKCSQVVNLELICHLGRLVSCSSALLNRKVIMLHFLHRNQEENKRSFVSMLAFPRNAGLMWLSLERQAFPVTTSQRSNIPL